MSSADNKVLGGVAPSTYRTHISTSHETQIPERALCTESLFDDDYETFKVDRSKLLAKAAQALIGLRTLPTSS